MNFIGILNCDQFKNYLNFNKVDRYMAYVFLQNLLC